MCVPILELSGSVRADCYLRLAPAGYNVVLHWVLGHRGAVGSRRFVLRLVQLVRLVRAVCWYQRFIACH